MKKLILLLVVFGYVQSHAASMQEDQSFSYKLEMSRNDKVCRHMQKVYNNNFQQPWKTEPFDLEGKTYSENSKFVFPRLPGVEHNDHFTFYMRYSKLPTSPEFEAIKWWEGRSTSGYGIYIPPPLGQIFPFLVAEFDINNDGKDDLVIKDRFGEEDGSQNRLVVFEKGTIDLSSPPTGWYLGDSRVDTHGSQSGPGVGDITITWTQIRPFIFQGRTYLSIYDLLWFPRGASHPMKKYMRVVEHVGSLSERVFDGPGALDENRFDRQGIKQICRFRMTPIKHAN